MSEAGDLLIHFNQSESTYVFPQLAVNHMIYTPAIVHPRTPLPAVTQEYSSPQASLLLSHRVVCGHKSKFSSSMACMLVALFPIFFRGGGGCTQDSMLAQSDFPVLGMELN